MSEPVEESVEPLLNLRSSLSSILHLQISVPLNL